MSTNHAADRQTLHACGGPLLAGEDYEYCDLCHAYSFDGPVPDGTDEIANGAAWDDGEDRSPGAK